MPKVAGHEIVATRGVGAFKKLVVIGIACHVKAAGWRYCVRVPADQLQELLSQSFPNPKLGSHEYLPILRENFLSNIESRRFGDRK